MKEAKKRLAFLQLLKGLSPKQREMLVDHLSDESTDILSETAKNVIFNPKVTQQLSDKSKRKVGKALGKHGKLLSKCCSEKCAVTTRRKAFKQMGGGVLGILLKTALPFIISEASKLFSKK